MRFRRSQQSVIFLTVFLDLLGFGMALPILPLYAERMHASEFEVGVLLAIYSVMQLFFAPYWGRLSDRVGRRPVLLVSILGSVLSQTGYALAPSFGGLLVARAVAGICGANISAAQAYMADITDERSRAAGMGRLGAAMGFGFVFGPALGYFARYGDRVPFAAAAGLALVNFILAAVFLVEPSRHANRQAARTVTWANLVRTVSNPRLSALILLFFVVTFGFANLEGTFSLYLARRFGFEAHHVAYVFVYIGVVMIGVQGGLVRRLVDRVGERALVIAGTLLMAAGMAMLAIADSLAGLLFGVGVVAVGNGLNTPSLSSLISRTAGEDRQGGVLGVAQSFGALARIFGPIAGALLLARGVAAPYWVGAAIIALACMFAAGAIRQPTASHAIPLGGEESVAGAGE